MRIFRPCRSATALDLLAEPAAHLDAGVAARQAVHVVLGVELVEELVAAAVVEPGVHLAAVEAEGEGGADREGRVLAEIVVGAGMGHLDGAVADRVGRLGRADDLARREGLDLELAVGRLGDVFGKRSRRRRRWCRATSGSPTAGATSPPAWTARWPAPRRRRPPRRRWRPAETDDASSDISSHGKEQVRSPGRGRPAAN